MVFPAMSTICEKVTASDRAKRYLCPRVCLQVHEVQIIEAAIASVAAKEPQAAPVLTCAQAGTRPATWGLRTAQCQSQLFCQHSVMPLSVCSGLMLMVLLLG